jgi:hypothetical protein
VTLSASMKHATMGVRSALRLAAVAAAASAVLLALGVSVATSASSQVVAYPSAQTIPGAGALPRGGRTEIALNAAGGDHEGAWVVSRGPGDVAAAVERGSLGPLQVSLAWGHFVRVSGRLVPDALVPWDGAARAPEQPNQPLYVRVSVPRGTGPGTYRGSLLVTVAGQTTELSLSVRVFPFTLPEQSGDGRTLLTSFHVSAPTYLQMVARLYGFGSQAERSGAHAALYRFLADYDVSPSSWGFGEPRTRSGYETNRKWWLDSAANMKEAAKNVFASMRVPVSSNRTAPANRIAGLDPSAPEQWCDYLRSVRSFWGDQGWLARSVPYLYAYDEPDLAGQRVVARQSKVLHDCWPGAKSLMTGNPEPDGANAFLYDGKNGDDLDIWAVLTRRFYGRFTSPAAPRNRERELAASISRVRKTASVWSYTYSGVPGTPGLGAIEPLSNPRQLVLWNALEGLHGLLYGQGTTSYDGGSPLDALSRDGEFELLYPGRREPIPSARLEQLRDGIEDWAILEAVRRRSGAARVRSILGGAGLFSADRRATKLACNLGCALKSSTKYSWPLWSHDDTTAGRIEKAHLAALRAAG